MSLQVFIILAEIILIIIGYLALPIFEKYLQRVDGYQLEEKKEIHKKYEQVIKEETETRAKVTVLME